MYGTTVGRLVWYRVIDLMIFALLVESNCKLCIIYRQCNVMYVNFRYSTATFRRENSPKKYATTCTRCKDPYYVAFCERSSTDRKDRPEVR